MLKIKEKLNLEPIRFTIVLLLSIFFVAQIQASPKWEFLSKEDAVRVIRLSSQVDEQNINAFIEDLGKLGVKSCIDPITPITNNSCTITNKPDKENGIQNILNAMVGDSKVILVFGKEHKPKEVMKTLEEQNIAKTLFCIFGSTTYGLWLLRNTRPCLYCGDLSCYLTKKNDIQITNNKPVEVAEVMLRKTQSTPLSKFNKEKTQWQGELGKQSNPSPKRRLSNHRTKNINPIEISKINEMGTTNKAEVKRAPLQRVKTNPEPTPSNIHNAQGRRKNSDPLMHSSLPKRPVSNSPKIFRSIPYLIEILQGKIKETLYPLMEINESARSFTLNNSKILGGNLTDVQSLDILSAEKCQGEILFLDETTGKTEIDIKTTLSLIKNLSLFQRAKVIVFGPIVLKNNLRAVDKSFIQDLTQKYSLGKPVYYCPDIGPLPMGTLAEIKLEDGGRKLIVKTNMYVKPTIINPAKLTCAIHFLNVDEHKILNGPTYKNRIDAKAIGSFNRGSEIKWIANTLSTLNKQTLSEETISCYIVGCLTKIGWEPSKFKIFSLDEQTVQYYIDLYNK